MAASTASMCLRKESLSVHSQSNSQDSSRFNATSSSWISRVNIVPSDRPGTSARGAGALSFFFQLLRPQEHRVEHGLCEDAGEGVLLGGVVAAEEGETRRRWVLGAVGEPGFRPEPVKAQGGVPGEGPEADDDLCVQQFELAGGVGEAIVALGRGGFVLRRGATDGCRDPE